VETRTREDGGGQKINAERRTPVWGSDKDGIEFPGKNPASREKALKSVFKKGRRKEGTSLQVLKSVKENSLGRTRGEKLKGKWGHGV